MTLVCTGKVAFSTGISLIIKLGGGAGGSTASVLNATSPPDPLDDLPRVNEVPLG